MIKTKNELKRFVEGMAPNIKNGYLLKDKLELFKNYYPDDDPNDDFPLITSKGRYNVISYYGNEIGFFIKLNKMRDELKIIITQEDTKWIDEVLEEDFGALDNIKIGELTFENVLKNNYGTFLNFNKFTCERGHEDVNLIKTYFSNIVDFIKKSRLLGSFSQNNLNFDARNSGQIVLQQILGINLSSKAELYNLLLNDEKKIKEILKYQSLKEIFADRLERIGFKKDSLLIENLMKDYELVKKEIELIIYFSIYDYIEKFKNSPIGKNLAKTKLLKNLPRYYSLFEDKRLFEETSQKYVLIESNELFDFQDIQGFIKYIVLKEFIEDDNIPKLDGFNDAIGIFQFEWEQLVFSSENFANYISEIISTFHPIIFKNHLNVVNNYLELSNMNINEIIKEIPNWELVYKKIIPFERKYQFIKNADVQNRILPSEKKSEICYQYESNIKKVHEKYYPHLLKQLETNTNLVCNILNEFDGTKDRLDGVLLVFDGMRYDFWKVLKESIEKARLPVNITENFSYSLIPSITEVSRYSIFANRSIFNKKDITFFEQEKRKFINSELDFYEQYEHADDYTGIILRFIDNRIHISNSLKGEFVDFQGIQEDFRRYVDSIVIPMLRHIFEMRNVKVIITSDHGFINLNKDNKIKDFVFDETIRESIKRINPEWDFENYSDMFFVSPNQEITKKIEDRFINDVIIIKSDEYERYHIPLELGGDAIIFPKVYQHLANASLKYNHGSLSMFETMVPLIKLTYKYE